jgi:hypothetical protein
MRLQKITPSLALGVGAASDILTTIRTTMILQMTTLKILEVRWHCL